MSSEAVREPTTQQRQAITATERNTVVVAGAGTGKTFVLVRRFVALLEDNPDWPIGAVVAITFTNRAADEMRARVRAEFEQRRSSATDDVSRRRWNDLLAQIEAARITTIHGLCSEIVRANAAIAKVDPAFEVLDEAQAVMLRTDAVHLALAEAVQPGGLSWEDAAAAANVIMQYNEQEIRDTLKDAHLLSLTIPPARDLNALCDEWEAELHKRCASAFVPMPDFDPPDNEDLMAVKARAALADLVRFKQSSNAQERLDALRDLSKINLQGGSTKLWPEGKDAKETLKQVRADALALLARIGEPPDEQDIDAKVLLNGWKILLRGTRSAYSHLKQLRAALDYDDLERYAAEVLANDAVAKRYVGAEFRHVMVDEFQDTSEPQWEIVQRIAPPDIHGTLFIVGDPKQSIYGFRGANVTVFETARKAVDACGGDILFLTESFRTHAPLVGALNGLFAEIMTPRPDALEQGVFVEFEPSQHLQSRRSDAPTGEYLATYTVPKGQGHTENDLLREARVVAQKIKALVKQGDPLVFDRHKGEYRGPRYGDIALLLRSFKGKLEVFERALNDEGIPYIALGGQGFYGRREVKDLLSALRALHNPADALALAAALHSPLFTVSDGDLLLLRQPQQVDGEEKRSILPLYDALMAEAARRRTGRASYDPLVFSADVLTKLAPLVGRAPVETLLKALIHETGYMAILAGLPDGQQMRANVEKLIDRARETGIAALNKFVRYLNDMTGAEAKEGGVALQADNAVRLSTIHSSKGMEYPVVWIANACSTSKVGSTDLLNFARSNSELGCKLPLADQRVILEGSKEKTVHPYVFSRNNILSAEREEAESLRLLYVATTRAQDALFISGVPAKDNISGWLGMIAPHFPPQAVDPAPPVAEGRARSTAPSDSTEPLDFPLARTLPAAPPPTRLHLSASDIKSLGGHFSGPEDRKESFTRRLRHRIFDEMAEPVEMLTYGEGPVGPGGRRFGTLVHDALRFGYDTLIKTDSKQVNALLAAMAWELGITRQNELEAAVDQARQMLARYRHSELAREIEQAEAVYRELPFVYQRDGHVIHGYIDLLYRDAAGAWTIVDYKTDHVKAGREGLANHARIYCLQLAVYSEAVAAQTGQTPRAMLVYLKYPDQPVIYDNDMLQAELKKVPLHKLIELLSAEAG